MYLLDYLIIVLKAVKYTVLDAFRLLETGDFTPVYGFGRSLIVHQTPFLGPQESRTNIVKFISGGGSTQKIAYV